MILTALEVVVLLLCQLNSRLCEIKSRSKDARKKHQRIDEVIITFYRFRHSFNQVLVV